LDIRAKKKDKKKNAKIFHTEAWVKDLKESIY
jgi:hypothetical protein